MSIRIRSYILIQLLFLLGYPSLTAWGKTCFISQDTLFSKFKTAQQLAYNNQTDSARLLCYDILKAQPEYLDAKVLIGQTLAWEARYDSARHILNEVIYTKYGHRDALLALIDIEMWTENHDMALKYCDIGLSFHPNDRMFLSKREKAKKDLNEHEESNNNEPVPVEPLPHIVTQQFNKARKLAYLGEYKEALELCNNILKTNSGYDDCHVLRSRILGWQGEFDKARENNNNFLRKHPAHADALLTKIDIEIWENNFERALYLCDSLISIYPDNNDFIDRKGKLEDIIGSMEQDTVETGMFLPGTADGYIPEQKKKSTFLEYYFDAFNQPYKRRWNVLSLGYKRHFNNNTAIARFNVGDLITDFDNPGESLNVQFNVDMYPKLGTSAYAYLNYGYSPHKLFPEHRAGLEYFRGISYGLELSLGLRYMYWLRDLFFYTGSISKYWSANMLSFRPYISYKSDYFSNSYVIHYKHYLNNTGDNLFIFFIVGSSPDQPYELIESYGTFNSYKISGGVNKYLKSNILGKIQVGYRYEEYLPDNYRHRVDFLIGVDYLF